VVPDDVLKMMAQKHIFLVATDGTLRLFENMMLGTRQPTAEERSRVDKEIQTYVDGNRDRLQRALKMGVPIVAGSDMYLTVAGKTRGEASMAMVEAYAAEGMKPMEIIRAATTNAAELLGLQDRIGTLEAGKLADIVAVPGDPLSDISVLEHARFVMKGGVVVKNQK
jgi:imidazolonepropionase-like amidohydrolase